jgi:pimeloyl-ACP methyl ester carboxylesterase
MAEVKVSAPDGRTLDVTVEGPEDGDLVINHHGTPGGGGEIYPPWVSAAAERGIRLAAHARPGYAGSDRHEGRSVADCAADAAAIADALGADRFYAMGGSGGGPHALACAALLPERVISAASIAGVAPFGAEGLDWVEGMGEENHQEFAAAQAGSAELSAFLAPEAEQLRSITGEQVATALGDLISESDAAVLTGEYADHTARDMAEGLAPGYWGWFDDDMAFLRDWGFDLASIGVPVSIWQGSDDRFVPPSHGEWLAAHVGGARPHLLEGEGHLSLALGRYGEILDELRAG